MTKTSETYTIELFEIHTPTQLLPKEQDTSSHRLRDRFYVLRQVLRFGLVGGLNTLVDLLILNCLLLLFPTTSSLMLLGYNSLAYSLGAVNSFLLNKYWTFGNRQRTTRRELVSFTLTTLFGIGWSNSIIWLASNVLHPFLVNPTVWANASKVLAVAGTALISYVGMRLWVFVSNAQVESLSEACVARLDTSRHKNSRVPQRSLRSAFRYFEDPPQEEQTRFPAH